MRFFEAATRGNANVELRNKVTPTQIQNRYMMIKKYADTRETVTRGQSGIEENRTEHDEILSTLAEEQDDFVSKKRRIKEKQNARTRYLGNCDDMLVSD
jgi:hypothetical protein